MDLAQLDRVGEVPRGRGVPGGERAAGQVIELKVRHQPDLRVNGRSAVVLADAEVVRYSQVVVGLGGFSSPAESEFGKVGQAYRDCSSSAYCQPSGDRTTKVDHDTPLLSAAPWDRIGFENGEIERDVMYRPSLPRQSTPPYYFGR